LYAFSRSIDAAGAVERLADQPMYEPAVRPKTSTAAAAILNVQVRDVDPTSW
jgi:hypothetical protein